MIQKSEKKDLRKEIVETLNSAIVDFAFFDESFVDSELDRLGENFGFFEHGVTLGVNEYDELYAESTQEAVDYIKDHVKFELSDVVFVVEDGYFFGVSIKVGDFLNNIDLFYENFTGHIFVYPQDLSWIAIIKMGLIVQVQR